MLKGQLLVENEEVNIDLKKAEQVLHVSEFPRETRIIVDVVDLSDFSNQEWNIISAVLHENHDVF